MFVWLAIIGSMVDVENAQRDLFMMKKLPCVSTGVESIRCGSMGSVFVRLAIIWFKGSVASAPRDKSIFQNNKPAFSNVMRTKYGEMENANAQSAII